MMHFVCVCVFLSSRRVKQRLTSSSWPWVCMCLLLCEVSLLANRDASHKSGECCCMWVRPPDMPVVPEYEQTDKEKQAAAYVHTFTFIFHTFIWSARHTVIKLQLRPGLFICWLLAERYPTTLLKLTVVLCYWCLAGCQKPAGFFFFLVCFLLFSNLTLLIWTCSAGPCCRSGLQLPSCRLVPPGDIAGEIAKCINYQVIQGDSSFFCWSTEGKQRQRNTLGSSATSLQQIPSWQVGETCVMNLMVISDAAGRVHLWLLLFSVSTAFPAFAMCFVDSLMTS